jgi:hypothetical protein
MLFRLGQLENVVCRVFEGYELLTLRRLDWFVEGPEPWHLKASSEPGRISRLCRIISLGQFTAFIATHLRPELVERHGAEHRYLLPDHLERHPDRSLAALASDPRITFGLKLGDGSGVCHRRIKARARQTGKWRYGSSRQGDSATADRDVDKLVNDSCVHAPSRLTSSIF